MSWPIGEKRLQSGFSCDKTDCKFVYRLDFLWALSSTISLFHKGQQRKTELTNFWTKSGKCSKARSIMDCVKQKIYITTPTFVEKLGGEKYCGRMWSDKEVKAVIATRSGDNIFQWVMSHSSCSRLFVYYCGHRREGVCFVWQGAVEKPTTPPKSSTKLPFYPVIETNPRNYRVSKWSYCKCILNKQRVPSLGGFYKGGKTQI